jgi:hypothetical protein
MDLPVLTSEVRPDSPVEKTPGYENDEMPVTPLTFIVLPPSSYFDDVGC